jgi:hypothetical protein
VPTKPAGFQTAEELLSDTDPQAVLPIDIDLDSIFTSRPNNGATLRGVIASYR